MILAVLFAIFIANGVSAEHARLLAEAGNGEKIPIDITVQDGSVITVSGQPYPPQPFFKQSVNLYDVHKHLEARKVVEEGRCYIRMFRGSFDKMKKVVDDAKSKTNTVTTEASEDWNIPGKEIKNSELEATVGSKIAEFCSGYRVFWLNQNKKVIQLQVRMAKRQWRFQKKPLSLSNGRFSISKGGLNYNFGKGLNAYATPTWKGGLGVKGGLKYNNGKGFSANLGGAWNKKSGPSFSAGLSWRFGGRRRGRGRGRGRK